MAKKYDIIVHDQDPQVPPKPQNGVIADSPETLKRIFGMCGEQVEIVREYEDEDSRKYGQQRNNKIPKDFKFESGGGIGDAPGFMKIDTNLPQYSQNAMSNADTTDSVCRQTAVRPPVTRNNVDRIIPTRHFEVGGIKCKMENGKMYQKQWMRLSDTEASEFRIVSDSNNKICPIKGKHIEIMKWVLIEDENNGSRQDDSAKELELLNG